MRSVFKPSASRSRNMRAIKSGNNSTTERRLRAHLTQLGISGWSVRPSNLPGRPDFVFLEKRIALFTDGCFWHGCPHCSHRPKTNLEYWNHKLDRNKSRDRAINRELKSHGYKVIRFWECQIRRKPNQCLRRLLRLLNFKEPLSPCREELGVYKVHRSPSKQL